jgi:hypothetical protein
MQVTLASKIRLHVPNVARQMIKRIIWRAKHNAPNFLRMITKTIQQINCSFQIPLQTLKISSTLKNCDMADMLKPLGGCLKL